MYDNLILVIDVCSRIWAGEPVSFLEWAAVIGVLATIYSVMATSIGIIWLVATNGKRGFGKIRALGRAAGWLAYQAAGRWFDVGTICKNACKLLANPDVQVSGDKRQVVQAGPLVVYLEEYGEHGAPDKEGHTLEKVFPAGSIHLHGSDLQGRLSRKERRRIRSVARWARKWKLAAELRQARAVAAFDIEFAAMGQMPPKPKTGPQTFTSVGASHQLSTLSAAQDEDRRAREERAARASLAPSMRRVMDECQNGEKPR